MLLIYHQNSEGRISLTTDMWMDQSQRSFMAITAHWVQSKTISMPVGPRKQLTFHSALVGFLQVPGRHTGEHLAQAFIFVLDRLQIAEKVCHLTFSLLWH